MAADENTRPTSLHLYKSCISCPASPLHTQTRPRAGLGDPVQLAQRLRAEVEAATGCTASAGIGPNMLLAKMATSRAKPNGCYRVARAEALGMLGPLPVTELPGVGWSTRERLQEMGVRSVADVWEAGKQVRA